MDRLHQHLQSLDVEREKNEAEQWAEGFMKTIITPGNMIMFEESFYELVMTGRSETWIQRDLEDQIAEEKAAQTSAQNQKSNMARQTKDIKIPEVLELLKKGYTRYKKDDQGFGSIQEHYSLTIVEMAEVARHPKLRGKKTKFPSRIRLIDEDEALKQEETKADEPEVRQAEDDVFS